jgi:hypothetical protein
MKKLNSLICVTVLVLLECIFAISAAAQSYEVRLTWNNPAPTGLQEPAVENIIAWADITGTSTTCENATYIQITVTKVLSPTALAPWVFYSPDIKNGHTLCFQVTAVGADNQLLLTSAIVQVIIPTPSFTPPPPPSNLQGNPVPKSI